MTAYEVSLLIGAIAGVFATLSLLSAVLGEGDARIFFTLAVLAAGGFYFAWVHSDGAFAVMDVVPALHKLVASFR